MPALTLENHRQRHVKLHRALDELAADYLRHHPGVSFSRMSALELMQWAYDQTLNPTPSDEEP